MSTSPLEMYMGACQKVGCKKNSYLLRTLPENVDGWPTLTEIDLNQNLVGRIGFQAVCDVIDPAYSLTRLCLANNGLDDTSMALLCPALDHHKKLTCLDLSGNPIRRKGGKMLLKLVKDVPSIQQLLLLNTLILPSLQNIINLRVTDNRQTYERPSSSGAVSLPLVDSTQRANITSSANPGGRSPKPPPLSSFEAYQNLCKVLQKPGHLETMCRKAFQKGDADASGELKFPEFVVATNDICEALSVPAPTAGDLKNIFHVVDTDGTGVINEDEFCNTVHGLMLRKQRQLRPAPPSSLTSTGSAAAHRRTPQAPPSPLSEPSQALPPLHQDALSKNLVLLYQHLDRADKTVTRSSIAQYFKDHGVVLSPEQTRPLDPSAEVSFAEFSGFYRALDNDPLGLRLGHSRPGSRSGARNVDSPASGGLPAIRHQHLRVIFMQMDSNTDGKVSKGELRAYLLQRGVDVPKDALQAFDAADTASASTLDFPQFVQFYEALNAQPSNPLDRPLQGTPLQVVDMGDMTPISTAAGSGTFAPVVTVMEQALSLNIRRSIGLERQLLIHNISAAFNDTDVIGEADPRAVFAIGGERKATEHVQNDCTPKWRAELEFAVPHPADTLEMTVQDKDLFSTEVVGSATLRLEDVRFGSSRHTLPLTKDGVQEGTITFSIDARGSEWPGSPKPVSPAKPAAPPAPATPPSPIQFPEAGSPEEQLNFATANADHTEPVESDGENRALPSLQHLSLLAYSGSDACLENLRYILPADAAASSASASAFQPGPPDHRAFPHLSLLWASGAPPDNNLQHLELFSNALSGPLLAEAAPVEHLENVPLLLGGPGLTNLPYLLPEGAPVPAPADPPAGGAPAPLPNLRLLEPLNGADPSFNLHNLFAAAAAAAAAPATAPMPADLPHAALLFRPGAAHLPNLPLLLPADSVPPPDAVVPSPGSEPAAGPLSHVALLAPADAPAPPNLERLLAAAQAVPPPPPPPADLGHLLHLPLLGPGSGPSPLTNLRYLHPGLAGADVPVAGAQPAVDSAKEYSVLPHVPLLMPQGQPARGNLRLLALATADASAPPPPPPPPPPPLLHLPLLAPAGPASEGNLAYLFPGDNDGFPLRGGPRGELGHLDLLLPPGGAALDALRNVARLLPPAPPAPAPPRPRFAHMQLLFPRDRSAVPVELGNALHLLALEGSEAGGSPGYSSAGSPEPSPRAGDAAVHADDDDDDDDEVSPEGRLYRLFLSCTSPGGADCGKAAIAEALELRGTAVPTDVDVDDLFLAADEDDTGRLSWPQFEEFYMGLGDPLGYWTKSPDQIAHMEAQAAAQTGVVKAQALYRFFSDAAGGGAAIGKSVVVAALGHWGVAIPGDVDVDDLFLAADEDDTGRLSWPQFEEFYMGLGDPLGYWTKSPDQIAVEEARARASARAAEEKVEEERAARERAAAEKRREQAAYAEAATQPPPASLAERRGDEAPAAAFEAEAQRNFIAAADAKREAGEAARRMAEEEAEERTLEHAAFSRRLYTFFEVLTAESKARASKPQIWEAFRLRRAVLPTDVDVDDLFLQADEEDRGSLAWGQFRELYQDLGDPLGLLTKSDAQLQKEERAAWRRKWEAEMRQKEQEKQRQQELQKLKVKQLEAEGQLGQEMLLWDCYVGLAGGPGKEVRLDAVKALLRAEAVLSHFPHVDDLFLEADGDDSDTLNWAEFREFYSGLGDPLALWGPWHPPAAPQPYAPAEEAATEAIAAVAPHFRATVAAIFGLMPAPEPEPEPEQEPPAPEVTLREPGPVAECAAEWQRMHEQRQRDIEMWRELGPRYDELLRQYLGTAGCPVTGRGDEEAKVLFSNGDAFEGTLCDGCLSEGTLTMAATNDWYKGAFEDNRFSGQGQYFFRPDPDPAGPDAATAGVLDWYARCEAEVRGELERQQKEEAERRAAAEAARAAAEERRVAEEAAAQRRKLQVQIRKEALKRALAQRVKELQGAGETWAALAAQAKAERKEDVDVAADQLARLQTTAAHREDLQGAQLRAQRDAVRAKVEARKKGLPPPDAVDTLPELNVVDGYVARYERQLLADSLAREQREQQQQRDVQAHLRQRRKERREKAAQEEAEARKEALENAIRQKAVQRAVELQMKKESAADAEAPDKAAAAEAARQWLEEQAQIQLAGAKRRKGEPQHYVQGFWEEGLPTMAGKYQEPGGNQYSGMWSEGRASGAGTFKFGDGGRFQGFFNDGLPDGTGTMIYRNGDRYEGAWRAGRQHGAGTYTWSNGDQYRGQWQDNQMHGEGVWQPASGDQCQVMVHAGKVVSCTSAV